MKYFVSTGEPSGDLHLSYLVHAMKKIDSNISFYGVCGKHSQKVGVTSIQDISELAVMGLLEAIKKYKFLKRCANEYIKFIKKEKIKKVILVDYGGFNLSFMKLLQKEIKDIVIYYYIPPKAWIWGESRVKKLKKANHIVVIFPWEVEFYKKHGVNAVYYGNPFLDLYKRVTEKGDSILLLPGSRKKEIETILPIILKVVKTLHHEKFILKLSDKTHINLISEDITLYKNLEILEESVSLNDAVKRSKYAIVTSGTVVLELSLLGLPGVVIYKIDIITAFFVTHILKLKYVTLPNITLDEEVYKELLQDKCEEKGIIEALTKIEKNSSKFTEQIDEIVKKLGGKNIIEKYANFFLKGSNDEEH